MIPKSGHRFSEKSCSNKRLERDDDSKKSHPALVAPCPGCGAGRRLKARDGRVQGFTAFVGERGLDQAFEPRVGIVLPAQARNERRQLVELGAPAFMRVAVTF